MTANHGGRLDCRMTFCTEKGTRPVQQDKFDWLPISRYKERGGLAVLSDGMGGMKNGEVYSAIAVERMIRHYQEHGPKEDMLDTLMACYQDARQVARAKCPTPDEPDGGATVVSVYIRNGWCAFLSVGDSRLYLWRSGALLQLNREQTLGVLLDENAALGYIPKEYARSCMRDAIENNLCEPEDKPCDMPPRPFPLAQGDVLLLMSDGIPHTLTDREIADTLACSGEDIAQTLGAAVRDKNNPKQDNYTIVAIRIS